VNRIEVTGQMSPLVQNKGLLQNLMDRAGVGQTIGEKNEVSQTWTDLERIYQGIAESIVETGIGIQNSIEIVKRYELEKDQGYVHSVNGAKKDLEDFTRRLILIKEKHKDKTGAVVSAEDLSLCMDCFNDYVMIGDQFKAIMFPTMLDINEYTEKALSQLNLQEEQSQEDLQNPNVVSDIEVIEKKD
jgi:hypothetical protein